MKTLAALALLLFTLAPGQTGADLSGKWTGTFATGEGNETIELNLKQKGKELSGTAGPHAEKQWPISNGVVDGARLTFQVQSDGPLVSFSLTLTGDRLVGDAAADQDGQKLRAKVDAGRVK